MADHRAPFYMRLLVVALGTTLAWQGALPLAYGQQSTPASSSTPAGSAATTTALTQAQLGALVAPIALYPDSLLAQILMASTYPLEVAEAAEWQKTNASITGTNLQNALQKQSWDPSVKSLLSFPQVLQMMGAQLSWMQQLGDAFLAQQKDVMAAVQALRAKAQASGTLKTNTQQKVVTQKQGSQQVIVIQPAKPSVVYVPTYDPLVVYGAWPYPAHPPVAYYPPGFVAGAAAVSFGVGLTVGASLWGGFHWGGGGGGSVIINNNVYNNFNHWNHPYMPPGPGPGPHPYGPGPAPGPAPGPGPHPNGPGPAPGQAGNPAGANAASRGGTSTWQHDPQHRGNVPYSNSQLQSRYGQQQQKVEQQRQQARQQETGNMKASERSAEGTQRNEAGNRKRQEQDRQRNEGQDKEAAKQREREDKQEEKQRERQERESEKSEKKQEGEREKSGGEKHEESHGDGGGGHRR